MKDSFIEDISESISNNQQASVITENLYVHISSINSCLPCHG